MSIVRLHRLTTRRLAHVGQLDYAANIAMGIAAVLEGVIVAVVVRGILRNDGPRATTR